MTQFELKQSILVSLLFLLSCSCDVHPKYKIGDIVGVYGYSSVCTITNCDVDGNQIIYIIAYYNKDKVICSQPIQESGIYLMPLKFKRNEHVGIYGDTTVGIVTNIYTNNKFGIDFDSNGVTYHEIFDGDKLFKKYLTKY